MEKEDRTIFYDHTLNVEIYHFKGLRQKFPDHFHNYYVIGLIQSGKRIMKCDNKTYTVTPDDIILLNPNQVHSCEQIENFPLDYFSLNISRDAMEKSFFDITPSPASIRFNTNIINSAELSLMLNQLYQLTLHEGDPLAKEELYFLLLGQLFVECSTLVIEKKQNYRFQETVDYINKNHHKSITLQELAKTTSLSKYYFIKVFVKEFGLSPFSYIQTIRINKAKDFIKQGMPLNEISYSTGFFDQSHFTDFFKRFTGFTPSQYKKIFKD